MQSECSLVLPVRPLTLFCQLQANIRPCPRKKVNITWENTPIAILGIYQKCAQTPTTILAHSCHIHIYTHTYTTIFDHPVWRLPSLDTLWNHTRNLYIPHTTTTSLHPPSRGMERERARARERERERERESEREREREHLCLSLRNTVAQVDTGTGSEHVTGSH